MGNYGFRSGKLIASNLKISGQYVVGRDYIRYEDFSTSYISGAVATARVHATTGAQAIPVYTFAEDVNDQISFRVVAPLSLKSKTKCNMRLYWTSALSGASAGDVVWDANYWSRSILISGSEASNNMWNISGIISQTGNTTATSEYNHMSNLVSGVLQTTDLTIPAGDVLAGDTVNVMIYRHGEEDADTLDCEASLICVIVEYREE